MQKIQLNKYNLANLLMQFIDKNGNMVFNNNDSISLDLTDISTNLYESYIVNESDTYHLISFKYYGTTRLWWLIAKINGVQDATEFPEPGEILTVLAPGLIGTILDSIKQK